MVMVAFKVASHSQSSVADNVRQMSLCINNDSRDVHALFKSKEEINCKFIDIWKSTLIENDKATVNVIKDLLMCRDGIINVQLSPTEVSIMLLYLCTQ